VVKKTEDQESTEQRTTGLYPSKKEKVVKPISVKSADNNEDSSKKPPKVTKLKSSLAVEESEEIKTEDDRQEQSTVQDKMSEDKATETPKDQSNSPTPKSDKKPSAEATPLNTDKEISEDDNAAQVPDTEAALKTEFIDEGQYHITVPKKRKITKSSKLSILLWVIFIIFLLVLAAYLYVSTFGIKLEDILDSVQEVIGQ